ncbi:MAG: hypothetical protein JWM76_3560 [Pseudonocardiales bacterium]|nr:hypothetical protein [Pseudonocardiales bacterium]
MARWLYALGLWSAAHRRRVIAIWLLVLIVVGGLGSAFGGTLSSVFSVPGIESQNAQNLLEKRFPAAAGGSARVVFGAPAGTELTSASAHTAIASSLQAAAKIPGVIAVTDPVKTGAVSADRTIGYSDVIFKELAPNVPQSAKDDLADAVKPARAAGLEVEFGGTAMAGKGKVGGAGEIIGVVIAFVILSVALGSLVAAGLPLLTALVGVAIGVMGVGFLSRFIEMTNTATVLATMIGLAVGIDYALFIVSRHREQLADPEQDIEDSIARAIGTAGSAVVFAGVTVIIALSALSAAGIPFLTVMGLAAAATVLIAVIIAITLVPAVLGFAGEKLRPAQTPRALKYQRRQGVWGLAWAQGISRAPLAVLLVALIGLLVIALPARNIRLGLPGNDVQPTSSTQHKSYELLTKGFGEGFNATLAVVVDAAKIPTAQRTPVVTALAAALKQDPDIAVVIPPVANNDATVIVLSVIPKTGPDAKATTDLVHRLRNDDKQAVSAAGGTVYVAGSTATNIDVSAKLASALPLFVAIIVILAFILLAIAFRSILVPLKAVLGFLLSVAASLGIVVWVFQYGHLSGLFGVAAAAPIVSFVPVLLIGVLFGLAMDYEVFLVSRMRENFEKQGDAVGAVASGVQRSGRVVSAAALIMAAVFAGFIFTPDPIVKSIAFALTIGVLTDAFVVRLTIVPAVMELLGRYAWSLPGWLDRILPNVDIEGASLPPRVTSGPSAREEPASRELAPERP